MHDTKNEKLYAQLPEEKKKNTPNDNPAALSLAGSAVAAGVGVGMLGLVSFVVVSYRFSLFCFLGDFIFWPLLKYLFGIMFYVSRVLKQIQVRLVL